MDTLTERPNSPHWRATAAVAKRELRNMLGVVEYARWEARYWNVIRCASYYERCQLYWASLDEIRGGGTTDQMG